MAWPAAEILWQRQLEIFGRPCRDLRPWAYSCRLCLLKKTYAPDAPKVQKMYRADSAGTVRPEALTYPGMKRAVPLTNELRIFVLAR